MAKKPTITTIASGYASNTQLNNNFTALRDGFNNTLSLDGSTPNAMNADLDMNSNDILNAQTVNTEALRLNGVLVSGADLSTAGASLYSDKFTGNGSTTAYTMSYEPFIKDNTQVYIDGIYQNKDGYSISGTTLTFSEAPPLNSAIEIVVARSLDFGAADAANIGYTQGGAGSVTRTVQSRLRDFVSVKDFGAVGDGVTDDAAAIQAAIDAAAISGGNVFIPYTGSDYITGATINMKQAVRLVMASAGANSTSANVIRPTSAVSVGLKADDFVGFAVENVQIDMSDMPINAIGIENRSTWHGRWIGCTVFGLEKAGQRNWKIHSEVGASRGCYWQHYEDCIALGNGLNLRKGWEFQGETTTSRCTTQTLVNCKAQAGLLENWTFDWCGSGIVFINFSSEGTLGDGIKNTNMTTGNAISLYGGEISSNAGAVSSGASIVVGHDVRVTGNGGGNTANNFVQVRNGNNIITGPVESRFVADRMQERNLNVDILATATLTAQYGLVNIAGSGGAVTMTSNPQIAVPTDNLPQKIVLIGKSASNPVTFIDGNGLRLRTSRTLAFGDILVLQYNPTIGPKWAEVLYLPSYTMPTYTATVSTSRSLSGASTLANTINVLGTLINDLTLQGHIK